MNSRELLSALGERLGWTVLHSLWQGAAIAVVLAIVLVMLRRRSAAARHAVCLLALIVLLATACTTALRVADRQTTKPVAPPTSVANLPPSPPLDSQPKQTVTVWSPLREVQVPESAAAAPNLSLPSKASWQERLRPSLPWIAGGWLCGVALLSMRHLGGWCRVRSWRRRGEEVDASAMSIFTQLQIRFSLEGRAWLRQSDAVIAPILTGVLRPMILLPARLLSGLTSEQLHAVLAHELAHLARRDTWSNLVQVIIETIFFYHPALWWISHRARMEREHAADDLALRVCQDRRQYAGALARLAELQSAPSLALAANGGSLLQRIRRIVLPPPREPATPGWTLPTLVATAGLLITLLIRAGAEDPKIITVKLGESVQEAIDAAPAGAIVRLGEGRWTERIRLTKPVKIEGAGWGKTILWPDRHDPEAGKRHATLLERIKNHPAATQTVIHEIVREIGPVDEPTILVEGTREVKIRGITVKGFTSPKNLGHVKRGISDHSLARVQRGEADFTDCVFTGYFRGIDIEETGSVTIEGCLIAGLWSEGIVAHPTSRLRLANSEMRNCYYSGVVIGPNTDAVVEKCRISGAAWHGVRYDDVSPLLRGNVIFGNARSDVYASGKTKATLQGNLFLSGGIWTLLGNEDLIENNTFVGENAQLGISSGAAPTVARNIFASQAVAIPCTTVNRESPTAKIMGAPKLEGNIFWNVKTALKVDDQPQPLPPGSTEADPKFVDATKKNYALAENSPVRAKNAGASSPLHPTGQWALLAEEKAIIPDGDTRDSQYWKEPGNSQPSKRRDELIAKAREDAKPWIADALQLDDEAKRTAAVASVKAAIESEDPARIRAGLSGFQRIGQVAFDKAAFRPGVRRLLKHREADIRATACSVLAATGKSEEDLALVISLTDDEDFEVKKAAAWALKWLSGGDFTGDAGRAIQKLLELGNTQLNKELWGTMWGTKVSPEIERIIVEASRNDDQGTGYSDVFYHALSVHLSKREPSVTRLIELLASEDPHNVGGRALWGLQQGVEADQRPRVAEAALKVIAARESGYMRSEAFDCLRMYGTRKNAEALRALLSKPGVSGDLKAECENTLSLIEQRPE